MDQYQLSVVVSLGVCGLISSALLTRTKLVHGSLKLPEIGQDAISQDPFEVVKQEDVTDGEPISADKFWSRMRWRKVLLTCILAAALALETVFLVRATREASHSSAALYSVRVGFGLYLVLVSAVSVKQEASIHWQFILHLFSLTGVTSLLLGISAGASSLPSPISTTHATPDGVVLKQLQYASTILYLVSCTIAATIPRGPSLHFSPERIYSNKTLAEVTSNYEDNVCGSVNASIWGALLFSYSTKVVMLGNNLESLEIGDLPIVPASMRATYLFACMRAAMSKWKLRAWFWHPKPGSGWELAYRTIRVNAETFSLLAVLSVAAAVLFYAPAFFLQRVVRYIETDPERMNKSWGLIFSAGLFFSNAIWQLATSQLLSISTTTLQARLRVQLNSILFAKTLVRKDVASSPGNSSSPTTGSGDHQTQLQDAGGKESTQKEDEKGFSSKAQIMTLMTTDVDRVSTFAWDIFTLVDSPIELAIGTFFLYNLLGVSCFYGLALTFVFLPLNHYAGKTMLGTQDNLMAARDERVALMNEILGGIRMLKFMAWERSFEARVLKIRGRELKNQHLVYIIETIWSCMWNGSPIIVTLVALWHFTVYRGQVLTPSIAFTTISVFQKMKFALNTLPETLINMLQSFVSLRRIERYLHGSEVAQAPPLDSQSRRIMLQSATITWPRDGSQASSASTSAAPTPRQRFSLVDLSIEFPSGELSLICGKLGSGKTLLLLALLGEADLLAGQVVCPRSPPDALASFVGKSVSEETWIVPGICAYVPQTAWLRNVSIRENILFELPYIEERYQKTLEVCALLSDLEILEDGDMSEIGERGVTLSGGQKARVSLARAVYSRASILLLDDVLSAVDAHTAHHLFHECLKGDLMRDRTVILVSHHVQLCAPDASYIVTLENGKLQFAGSQAELQASGILNALYQSNAADPADAEEDVAVPDVEKLAEEATVLLDSSKTTPTLAPTTTKSETKKTPKKLIEEEKRAVGRISSDVWSTYLTTNGGLIHWILFFLAFAFGAINHVLEAGWLKIWSGSTLETEPQKSPAFYMSVYAAISLGGLVLATSRWFVLYHGGMRSASIMHQRMLESILFTNLRFHDTVSRGRLLNRFGKDFETVDSSLPDFLGQTTMHTMNIVTSYVIMASVGGLPFLGAAAVLAVLYYNVGKVYGQTSRDMRRLDSVTRSPLYSMYGETIAGVSVIRAFGASSKFLRDMLCCVDTNTNPYYWMWNINRWLSVRFNLLSSVAVGVTAVIAVSTPGISASTAGFVLAFSSSVMNDLLMLVQRFVGLEQSMVAVERIKEFTDIKREAPEFIEPRPPVLWPAEGKIRCENLAIRYAPDLPDVLHNLNFAIKPGEKIGVLGRTGSGKSTLALSFFRFVEPTNGRILIDDIDISEVGLSDLRSRLTIIPQDPTILSGTLRSALDVFNEYDDADIYEALRRVHLIPAAGVEEDPNIVNANVFRSLDSSVSEGGENFSTGEKQLLCMARAILKRTKVLLMDEATASVDYATDELIGKTIRQEFAQSTILTIAHRLRTVIDYDRVMLLDQGRIVEFDAPGELLGNPSSKFHALCKATGRDEFAVLKKMTGVT